MKTIQNIREEGEYVIELVKGYDESKAPFYAYVIIQKSNLGLFRQKLAAGATQLADYSVVMASGQGHTPPPEVLAEIKRKLAE